mmetsp:Transcript_61/g.546  ORF Transcript_61/g.546 Transcript_61/m.546 type:complete len:89 (-) Transcript_61:1137-1403(-)
MHGSPTLELEICLHPSIDLNVCTHVHRDHPPSVLKPDYSLATSNGQEILFRTQCLVAKAQHSPGIQNQHVAHQMGNGNWLKTKINYAN